MTVIGAAALTKISDEEIGIMGHAQSIDTAADELPSGVFNVAQPPTSTVRLEVQQVNDVVQAMRAVDGSNSLRAALEIGGIIFRHIFRSDERLLRARGRKCSSFRRLASHPELSISSSSLWRAVAIFELSRRFPELTRYRHTGVGHVSVVLGLPAADQFRLLRETEVHRYTRRHLQTVASQIRNRQKASRSAPRVIERLAGLEMLARDVGLENQLGTLGEVETRHALDAIFRIRQRMAHVETRLFGTLAQSSRQQDPVAFRGAC